MESVLFVFTPVTSSIFITFVLNYDIFACSMCICFCITLSQKMGLLTTP